MPAPGRDVPHLNSGERMQRSARKVTVGVAGGGQLAQMMLPAAAKLGLDMIALDPDPNCSCVGSAAATIVAPFDSLAGLRELAQRSDVVTLEIERIDADVLGVLEEEGHTIRPSAPTLRTIQDKLLQKQFLADLGIATSAFREFGAGRPIARSLPCVWKARRDGYDGRGVAVLRSRADVDALSEVPALLEDLIDIDYELAILVARGGDGTVAHFPLVEIVMSHDTHVMERVIAPAGVDAAMEEHCRSLATQVAEALDYVGILALEFFVDRAGAVFVNELSPRPHNSGHYTIEACVTSQFEQHLRAVADLELGSTELRCAAVTFNVLGAPDAFGVPRYVGFDRGDAQDAIFVHCYDKGEVRPGRKMGHVTVLAATRALAVAKADEIKDAIRVESADE
jgi:5-(carboxyamino)imidazole ribonucleotide synthase